MTKQENLNNLFELWYSTIKEMEELSHFLTPDKINKQFYRRLFLRNVFSIIETYLHVTREILKFKISIDGNESSQISWEENMIISEQKVVLNDQGKVIAKCEFQKFEPSLKFLLTIFARVFNSTSPKFGDINFEKLKNLIKRRNDITHPKSLAELTITDQETKDIVAAFAWFMETHGSINKDFLQWLEETFKKNNWLLSSTPKPETI